MQIYLVGGAVRDELLGKAPRERDWVVVGGSAQRLLEQGFVQIDSHFPVFRHPQTGDEYALARKEIKTGSGHKGFTVESGPEVTLLEDLARRDLRINAIARAADGSLIDPYGGQVDIRNRTLQHITPAFVEDPLRVLRLARFHAVLGNLGFEPAPATLKLARRMVARLEFASLGGDRSWRETLKVLDCQAPHRYFQLLSEIGAMDCLLPGVNWRSAQFNRFDLPDHLDSDNTKNGCEPLLAILACAFAGDLPQLKRAVSAMVTNWPIPRGARETLQIYVELLSSLGNPATAQNALELCTRMSAWRRPNRFQSLMGMVIRFEKGQAAYDARRLKGAFEKSLEVKSAPLIANGLTGVALGRKLDSLRLKSFFESWDLNDLQSPDVN